MDLWNETTISQMAAEASKEYNSEITTAHHGGAFGRPFWNVCASQFMFNPCFQFPIVPGCEKYRFTAVDCTQKVHVFEADSPTSLLTPIWSELPEGFVELKVEALDSAGHPWTLAGARTFYKLAPFAGPGNYPKRARSYKECAHMAYKYVFEQPYIKHWLLYGTPDPDYDFNVYPSKTISSIIRAMIRYAEMTSIHLQNLPPSASSGCFCNPKEAIQLAMRAADFLISITFPEESPLAGLPPTYYLDFRTNLAEYNNEAAVRRLENLMMIYPAEVGSAYLMLEHETGERRYLEAAYKIAEYYRMHVQENGSWYLFVSTKTGKATADNYCMPNVIMKFLHEMYLRTKESVWQNLEHGCYRYIARNGLELYHWEGQFEDSVFSLHYSNLAHNVACDMIRYITANKANDVTAMAQAEDLLRFVEDQFVVWRNFAPWNRRKNPRPGADISQWFSPAGLEQYNWYMPISSSTADIMSAFLHVYKVNKRPLLLAKACVLGDMITRMQNPETGMIPTHWMRKSCIDDGGQLWINCMLYTADAMLQLADVADV